MPGVPYQNLKHALSEVKAVYKKMKDFVETHRKEVLGEFEEEVSRVLAVSWVEWFISNVVLMPKVPKNIVKKLVPPLDIQRYFEETL